MEKGRKKKIRYIQRMPKVSQFSPRGKPGRPDEVELRVDEFEALKLADYQGYDQTQGAREMGFSRPTFGRILRSGRKKLVDALVNAKTIKIRIGGIQVGVKRKDLPGKIDIDSNIVQKEASIRKRIIDFSPKKVPSRKK